MTLADSIYRFTAYVMINGEWLYPNFENDWLYQYIKRKI